MYNKVSFFLILIFYVMTMTSVVCQVQRTDSGRIDYFPDFPSKHVVSRNIEIWLPSHFENGKKFSVLYMHDGQMLYDAGTTWNKQSWNVDSTASYLMESGLTKDFIIVGIWNDQGTRHRDYFPAKPFNMLSTEEKKWVTTELLKMGRITEEFVVYSDDYLRFIVQELKPFIDSKYDVMTDKDHTFIAGSSMGGLISMYAMFEYPEVFGGAACLSTHWPGVFTVENNPIPEKFVSYVRSRLAALKNNKIYFDHGDQTLDALYPPLQARVDQAMQAYPKGLWTSRFFPGADHSEKAWADRFGEALLFLLKKE